MDWQISQLNRTLPDGVVYTAHWRVSKTDRTATGTVYGTISFPAKAPDAPDFIPYDQLTEADVIGWVKAEMGADQVAAHEANVESQIYLQLNPTQESGVPW